MIRDKRFVVRFISRLIFDKYISEGSFVFRSLGIKLYQFLKYNGNSVKYLDLAQTQMENLFPLGYTFGIAEVTGSNPVEALIFFRLLPSNCLNWKIYGDITLPGVGGTLRISGCGCAARTLEPLAYTRASFSWILLPYTRVNSWFL